MPEIQASTPTAAWARLTGLSEVDRRVGLSWISSLSLNRAAPAEVLHKLLSLGVTEFFYREDLPDEVLDAVAVHPDRLVRTSAAESGRLSDAQWDRLKAASPEPELREFIEERIASRRLTYGSRGVGRAPHSDAVPPQTPDEIAAMASETPDIDAREQTTALWWIGALHADAEAMRQLAHCPKLLVRRSVARAPRLPADVVALLARDEDSAVRLFLAESCDDAPPEMLLEVAAWWNGSLSFPGRPRNHPNFPRDGLLRFAADPNPLLRQLALDDPDSTVALVERFSRDPDTAVRRSAAQDQRLTPGAARRLAADRDQGVRWRACINPVLPEDELVSLLLDRQDAEMAAYNPAIPAAVMLHMLELAAPLLNTPRHRARK